MRTRDARLLALVAAAAMAASCENRVENGAFARAKTIGGLDEAIGGEMAVARPGDFLLENDRVRVAILRGRDSMGPGLYGGSLVDADRQVPDPAVQGGRGRDQWNELFPLANMNVPFAKDVEGEPPTVTVLKDGADGGEAIVRVASPATPFLSLLDLLWGLVQMPDMQMVTDYIAEPGKPWIKIRTTVGFQPGVNPVDGTTVDPVTGNLDVISVGLQGGLVTGDFYLAGGSVDVFGPGIGFDEDGAVYESSLAGQNTFTTPFRFPFLAANGDGVSYGIATKEGDIAIPLFTSSQTAVVGGSEPKRVPGAGEPPLDCKRFYCDEAFVYERYFLVGRGDVGSIVDAWIELTGRAAGTVFGRVVEQGTGAGASGVDVFVYEPGAELPFSQWRTDVDPYDDVADGSFAGRLPVGDWELLVHRRGRPDGERVAIRVDEGSEQDLRLEVLRGGVLTFTVRDERGRTVPAKVSLYRHDPPVGTRALQAGLGDGFIGDDPAWVAFAEYGTGEIPLEPGTYRAVASRGVEYELGVSEPFVVDALRGAQIDLEVFRSVDTTGWIAADFHVHSSPSHDSGVQLDDRIRSYVAEGMEFFASTDHDYLTDFAPVVEAMNLEPWLQTAVGVETTTIEIGHYLGFPMQRHWLGDVGGAYDWTGHTPQEILDALREQGREAVGYEPMIFVAHPRSGILGYFDQFGVDPFAGQPESPGFPAALEYDPSIGGLPNPNPLLVEGNLSMDFDALELFTGKEWWTQRTPTTAEVDACATDAGCSMFDWHSRRADEQEALIDGTFKLSTDFQGAVDDWFMMLDLGFRQTALGNSDTHDMTSIEAGCPRNFVMSSTDSPGAIDEAEIAQAVKDHRVVASYGPFVTMEVNGAIIGSDVAATDGKVLVHVTVQAPSWIDVDHVQIIENGTVIADETTHPELTPLSENNVRVDATIELEVAADSWFVVIVEGDGSMSPVFTPVELPPIPLDQVVSSALGVIEIVGTLLGEPKPYPATHPVHPYAITNPIWVDANADGAWQAPGLPAWWIAAEAPEE